MRIQAGKVIAEKGVISYLTEAKESNVSVVENGGKFVIPADVTTAKVSTSIASTIGYNTTGLTDNSNDVNYNTSSRSNAAYEIGTLNELETFRDLVNGGFTFKGASVELTADITLEGGWTPIGEGSRDVGATNQMGTYLTSNTGYFGGSFNGNGHTISNLNNNGYTPNAAYKDDKSNYVYGFFGILANGASISNIIFKNVEIDTITPVIVSNTSMQGDSVATLVGFCAGNVTISNITVESGSIKGIDSVGGIIGRWYGATQKTELDTLINKASVTVNTDNDSGKVAGIIGYYYNDKNADIEFKSCSNSGKISAIINNTTHVDTNGKYVSRAFADQFGTIWPEKGYTFTIDEYCTCSGSVETSVHETTGNYVGEVNHTWTIWENKTK